MPTETEIVNLKLVSSLFAETEHLPLLRGRIRPVTRRDMKPGTFLTYRSGNDFLSIELVLSPTELLCYSGEFSSVLPDYKGKADNGYQRFIPDYKARQWLEGFFTALLYSTGRTKRIPFKLNPTKTTAENFRRGKLEYYSKETPNDR